MKKNEMGKILKVFGVIVIVLGIISSLILGFTTMHGGPMNEIMGYMMEPTIGYNFSKAIFGIFASVVAGLILMGLSEIINILEEKRENIRRLCMRFGIHPAESNPYNGGNGPRNCGNPNMAPNMNPNMNGNINPNANHNGNANPNANANHNGNASVNANPNVSVNANGNGNIDSSIQQNQASNMNGQPSKQNQEQVHEGVENRE